MTCHDTLWHFKTLHGIRGQLLPSVYDISYNMGEKIQVYIRVEMILCNKRIILYKTRQVSSMIHSLGQTNSHPSNEDCFRLKIVLFWKVGMNGRSYWRTYERTTCAKTMITTGRDCGSASWINSKTIPSGTFFSIGRRRRKKVRFELLEICGIFWSCFLSWLIRISAFLLPSFSSYNRINESWLSPSSLWVR